MTTHRFAGPWVLILCMLQTPTPVSQSDILNRQVALDHSPRTSADAMSLLLAEAHVPGGMISIYNGCGRSNPQVFSLAETSLKQGLDYVSTIDPARKWTYADGLILVGLEQANNTILNTVIHDIEIRPGDALSLSAQRLFDTPEVQTSIQRAGLDEISPELGFGQISRIPKAASSETSEPTRRHEVTLVKALNILASMKGTAVWEYEQFTCNNKSSFRLNWIVK